MYTIKKPLTNKDGGGSVGQWCPSRCPIRKLTNVVLLFVVIWFSVFSQAEHGTDSSFSACQPAHSTGGHVECQVLTLQDPIGLQSKVSSNDLSMSSSDNEQ